MLFNPHKPLGSGIPPTRATNTHQSLGSGSPPMQGTSSQQSLLGEGFIIQSTSAQPCLSGGSPLLRCIHERQSVDESTSRLSVFQPSCDFVSSYPGGSKMVTEQLATHPTLVPSSAGSPMKLIQGGDLSMAPDTSKWDASSNLFL